MPTPTDKTGARKDEAAKTKRTKAEVTEAAVARLKEKLAKAETRASITRANAVEKKGKQGAAARVALERAFVLAEKAGVVLAVQTAEAEAKEGWCPLVLDARPAVRMEDAEGRPVLVLHATSDEVLLADEDEATNES